MKDIGDVRDSLDAKPLPPGWEISPDPKSTGYNVYDGKDNVLATAPTAMDALRAARAKATPPATPGLSLDRFNPRTGRKMAAPDLTVPGAHAYFIKNTAGETVGTVDTEWDPHVGDLHIADVKSNEGANSLGPAAVTQLRAALLEQYPDARTLSGYRVTGSNPDRELFQRVQPDQGRKEPTPAVAAKIATVQSMLDRLADTPANAMQRTRLENTLATLREETPTAGLTGVDYRRPRISTTPSGMRPRAPAPTPTAPGATPEPPARPLPPRVNVRPEIKPVAGTQPTDPITEPEHYFYSPGTPAYRDAFTEAGLDPAVWVNKPIAEQVSRLATQTRTKFGFKDVQVHPKTDLKTTRDQLLNIHHNLANMMHAQAMPLSAASLHGTLKLGLAPKNFNGSKAMGSFRFGDKTITLQGGSNSLAHEWWHGVDNHLAEALIQNPNARQLLTHAGRMGELDINDPLQHAYAQVINTLMYHQNDIALRRLKLESTAKRTNNAGQPTVAAREAQAQLEALDKGSSQLRIPASNFRAAALASGHGDYLGTIHELFARAGEAYTGLVMHQQGMDTAGVVKPNEAYINQSIAYLKMAYPDYNNRLAIFGAFDRLRQEWDRAGINAPGPVADRSSEAATVTAPGRVTIPAEHRPLLRSLAQDIASLVRPSTWKDPTIEPAFTDPDRPKSSKALITRAGDGGASIFNSAMGILDRIRGQDTTTPGAKRAILAIRDLMSANLGSRSHVPETMLERARRYAGPMHADLQRAFADNGLVNRLGRINTTKLQDQMLVHVLTTGDTSFPTSSALNAPRVPIPRNLIEAARDMRNHVLDPAYDMLKRAKADIHYARTYFPRKYDDLRVFAEPDHFLDRQRELNRLIFDQDIAAEADADKPARLAKWWAETPPAEREQFGLLHPAAAAALNQLRNNLNQLSAMSAHAAGAPLSADQLHADNQDILAQHGGTFRDHLAATQANSLLHEMVLGKPLHHDIIGPNSNFLRGRTRPPETDQIMRDFLIQKPREILTQYIHSASEIAARTELIGPDEATNKVEALLTEAKAAGLLPEDIRDVRKAASLVFGAKQPEVLPAMTKFADHVAALGQAMLMQFSAASAMAEPFMTPMATGSSSASYRMMAGTFAGMANRMTRGIPGLGRLFGRAMDAMGAEDPKAAAELAEDFGIIGTDMMEHAMSARYGGSEGDPNVERFRQGLFRLNLVTPVTRMARTSAVLPGTRLIKRWLQWATEAPASTQAGRNRQEDAQRLLREFGVHDRDWAEMRDYLNETMGLPDRVQARDRAIAQVFASTLARLMDTVNINPNRAQRAMGGFQSPAVRAMLGLAGWTYGSVDSVFNPAMKRLEYQGERAKEQAQEAGAGRFRASAAKAGGLGRGFAIFGTALATMVAGNLLATMVKQYIFNRPAWDAHVKEGGLAGWLGGIALDQSGIGGKASLLVNALAPIRYASDLGALMNGPYWASVARYMMDVVHMFGGKGPDDPGASNTHVWKGIYALQRLAILPGAALAMIKLASMLPVDSPLAKMLSAAAFTAFSPGTQSDITDVIAGEKGTAIPKPTQADETGEEPAEDDRTDLERQQDASAKQSDAGSGAGLGPWAGFLDDGLVPLAKAVPKFMYPYIMGIAGMLGIGHTLWNAHRFKTEGVPPETPVPPY